MAETIAVRYEVLKKDWCKVAVALPTTNGFRDDKLYRSLCASARKLRGELERENTSKVVFVFKSDQAAQAFVKACRGEKEEKESKPRFSRTRESSPRRWPTSGMA